MSNDAFPLIPPIEDFDFAKNCTLWGNWLATWFLPNPWDRYQGLMGGLAPSLMLIEGAFPPDVLSNIEQEMSSANITAKVSEWWTYTVWSSFTFENGGSAAELDMQSDFVKYVLEPGINKCPDEVCKAQANTGNADITGIGVSPLFESEAI